MGIDCGGWQYKSHQYKSHRYTSHQREGPQHEAHLPVNMPPPGHFRYDDERQLAVQLNVR
ncbi:hypothetical protein GCM10009835_30560 [Planosporangium flavigriseum]|uniref:Uncharacterized protein n=1 Tax=Planosporangium flavigriseum TaxID=373681 RepID=A0A8J3PQY1_9ACTN|nr:hypothetical protein Pfl04_49750 [Planosporangium flavigriseum]